MHQRFPRQAITYVTLYIALLAFFLLSVRSGDDFGKLAHLHQIADGGPSFGGLLSQYYAETNGRVLGNFLHLVLADAFVLNAFVRAAVTLGMIWGVARVARLTYFPVLPLIALAVLVPAVPVMRQAVIWSAGFYNYAMPMFLVLLLVVLVRDVRTRWQPVAVLVVAFASCLFMETVTLALVVVSVICAIAAVVRRRLEVGTVALIVGSVGGAVAMFGSPAYRAIAAGEDAYRPALSVGDGPIAAIAERVMGNLPDLVEYLVLDLSILYLAVTVIVVVVLKRARVSSGLALGIAVSLVIIQQIGLDDLGGVAGVLISAAVFLAYLAFGFSLATALWGSHREAAHWVLGGGAVAMPFLVIAPFGPRNFFITAMAFIVAVLIVAAPSLNRLQGRAVGRTLVVSATVAALPLFAVLAVNKAVDIRNYSQAVTGYKSGNDSIVLRAYPFQSLVHDANNGRKYAHGFQDYTCVEGECEPARKLTIKFE